MEDLDWRRNRTRLSRLAPKWAKALGYSSRVDAQVDHEQKADYEGAYAVLGGVGRLQIVVYLGGYFMKAGKVPTLQFWAGVEIAASEKDSLRQLLKRSGYPLNEINQGAYLAPERNWLPQSRATRWYRPHMDTSRGHEFSWFGRYFDGNLDDATVSKQVVRFLVELIERLRPSLDMDTTRLLVLIGGADQQNGDYSLVVDAAASGRTIDWSTPKDARPGDRVLLYIASPISSLVVKAVVLGPAYKTSSRDRYDYRATIGQLELLTNRVSIQQLKKNFPRWDWLRRPRSHAVVPEGYCNKLWSLVHEETLEGKVEHEASNLGAGFGDPEKNRLVEKAAIKKVTRVLEERGYAVTSRESDRVGYDLEAKRAKKELHVEVKGVSGGAVKFVITRREWRRAEQDDLFCLMVVTKALTRGATLHEFHGRQIVRRFKCSPIAFFAELT